MDINYRVIPVSVQSFGVPKVHYQAQVSTDWELPWQNIDEPWEHEQNAWAVIRAHADARRTRLETEAAIAAHVSTPKSYEEVLAELDAMRAKQNEH